MNKTITIIFSILLLVMSANAAINIIETGASLSGNHNSQVSGNFNITTTEMTPLITLSSTNLTMGSILIPSSSITLTPSTISNLNQITAVVSYQVNIPQYIAPGTYSGIINATNTTYSDTFNLVVNVNTTRSLAYSSVSISGNREENQSATLTITNNGNIANNINIFVNSTFKDSSNRTIAVILDKSSLSINPSASGSINIQTNIPASMEYGAYNGIIAITGDVTYQVPLEIKVTPQICEEGQKGNDLSIDIDQPDSGDDFYPGESIDIELNIKNSGSDDKDVIIEAFLYDLKDGKKLKSVKSKSVNIDNGDDQDFKLNLTIPYKIKDGNEHMLYIKAYEDGDEDVQCREITQTVDIKKKDHDVTVSELIFSPSTASCGTQVSATATILNIGDNDEENVKLMLKNSELGLNQNSLSFDIDKYLTSSDEVTERFTFTIPTDAETKKYYIEAITDFDSGDSSNSKFFPLSVDCINPVTSDSTVMSVSSSLYGSSGSLSIPVTIVNNENVDRTYTLEFTPAGSWSTSTTSSVLVPAKQTITYTLQPIVNSGIQGTHSGTVSLKLGSKLIASKAVSAEIGTSSNINYQPTSYIDKLFNKDNSMMFWIIGDIVLVIVGIYFLRLLFRRN